MIQKNRAAGRLSDSVKKNQVYCSTTGPYVWLMACIVKLHLLRKHCPLTSFRLYGSVFELGIPLQCLGWMRIEAHQALMSIYRECLTVPLCAPWKARQAGHFESVAGTKEIQAQTPGDALWQDYGITAKGVIF